MRSAQRFGIPIEHQSHRDRQTVSCLDNQLEKYANPFSFNEKFVFLGTWKLNDIE